MILTLTIIIIAMLLLLFGGVPVAFTLVFLSMAGLYQITGGTAALSGVASIAFHNLNSLGFLTIPLFVLMSSIINQTGMGRDLYDVARKWLGHLPGGLAQATIAGCAALGATTGSSVACALTMGKVALPEMERYHYSDKLTAGSIAGGGALGMLIPPSLSLITYSVITDVSVGQLFIAAIIPGLLATILCMAYVTVTCLRNPQLGPAVSSVGWKPRLWALLRSWPLIVLILGVLGSIYFGICTATESAAIGVFVSTVLGFFLYKTLNLRLLFHAALDAALTTATISFIVFGGFCFAHFFTLTGIAQFISSSISGLNVSKWIILICMNVLWLIMGCFLDVGSILLLTIPTMFPVVMSLGFDPIWFGVIAALNLEMAVMTPPFGLNLYVLKNISNIPMSNIILGSAPFVAVYALALIIVMIFPSLALWLVGSM